MGSLSKMEMIFVILGCGISLVLGIWAIDSLSPGLDTSNEYTKRTDTNNEDE